MNPDIFCQSYNPIRQIRQKMYPYIICFCGRQLGELYALYMAIKADRVAEMIAANDMGEADPAAIYISGILNVELGDVLDDLKLDLPCCRARMLGQATMDEFR